jgi:pilus assembly protein Flp/PilA
LVYLFLLIHRSIMSLKSKIPRFSNERGQGLAEYALIVSLVAIVVVSVLVLIGPQINNVYGQVNYALGYRAPSPLVSLAAERTGNEGNDATATLVVSSGLSITLTDSQSGQSQTLNCSGTCQHTFLAVGHLAGTVTATVDEFSLSAGYPPKNL